MHLTFVFGYTVFKVTPQNGLWNLANGPTILAQSDQWDLLSYGEIRTARAAQHTHTHTHTCHISMYFLVITYYFIVICTFVSYFALRISIERDLYDMWTNSLTLHSPLSWSSEICKPNLLHSFYVALIHSALSYNFFFPQDTTSDSHIEELESNHSN